MQRKEILVIARARGLENMDRSNAELIRAIQRAEGNFDCFGSAVGYCDQRGCLWLATCVKADKGV